jgi:hypothetical protein
MSSSSSSPITPAFKLIGIAVVVAPDEIRSIRPPVCGRSRAPTGCATAELQSRVDGAALGFRKYANIGRSTVTSWGVRARRQCACAVADSLVMVYRTAGYYTHDELLVDRLRRFVRGGDAARLFGLLAPARNGKQLTSLPQRQRQQQLQQQPSSVPRLAHLAGTVRGNYGGSQLISRRVYCVNAV